MKRITAAAAAIVLGLPAVVVRGGTAAPVADTVVMVRLIGKPGSAGTQTTLPVKTDNPAGRNDRLAVLRFDLVDKAAVANPSLTLHLAKTEKSATSGAFEVYGVTAGAVELTFDEAVYAAGGKDCAVDSSGNRLQEKFVFDADAEAKGLQPIATATFAEGETKVTFSGGAMKTYIDAADGNSVAFVVIAVKPEEKAETPSVMFHSREAGEGVRPTLSWD